MYKRQYILNDTCVVIKQNQPYQMEYFGGNLVVNYFNACDVCISHTC